MATHDYVIDNQSAPAFRSDLNSALQAIVTNNSSATAPATTYANMIWYDTATNILKKRNEANSGWINLGTIDETAGTFTPSGERALASQAQAEAGTDNTTVMTPLRVAQAIDVQVPAPLTRGTAVATTSGSAVTFTGIPSTAKKITVLLEGVSASSTGNIWLQLGDSGGLEATGYNYGVAKFIQNGVAVSGGVALTYFQMTEGMNASGTWYGSYTLENIDGNSWVYSGLAFQNVTGGLALVEVAGSKTLSATLDRVSIYLSSGTFDAGKVNIMWE